MGCIFGHWFWVLVWTIDQIVARLYLFVVLIPTLYTVKWTYSSTPYKPVIVETQNRLNVTDKALLCQHFGLTLCHMEVEAWVLCLTLTKAKPFYDELCRVWVYQH